ncbi:hypothetical protein D9758_018322 [Tetrapyrgos nigripes]|uniref:Uncharacterized protein n=1 Tax=Tetrapyrgos nigripes TaxID=182062 RepID=A0A8H5F157_9AGAR|nr:hypothetical protein D9758_018322 [Tetrapyrgos nigripes]
MEAEEPTEEVSDVMESPPALLAMGQMVDTDTKIAHVIRVGKQKYWRGLASSTHFPGLGLRACLSVLHKDIVIPWNINDPEKVYETYKSTPDTVRCLMSYIIHLFNIMRRIFHQTLPGPGYKVSTENLQNIIEEYKNSSHYSTLSDEINQFIRKTEMSQYGTKDHVLEKLEELISLK